MEENTKKNVSRDEMNLAEFPLTVLSSRSNPNIKTLEFQDTIKDKNKQPVKRKWVITGADKFGLPTASDDEVLLGLMKLTVDDGFNDRKIYFTRYELLKALRWTTEGRSYTRLQNALDRLSGVRVKATNAFYDNVSKVYSTKNFGIIDAYEINDGRGAGVKPSFFTWSEEIFKSFQVGFIKKLDLDFYLDLQSSVSKRLYRYLDKQFWRTSVVRTNLFTLAHEKIGVSRTYTYASSIRQQIDPAIDELIKCGFLARCEYEGRGKNTEIILYSSSCARKTQDSQNVPKECEVISKAITTSQIKNETLADKLVRRGLKSAQVETLLTGKNEEELKRMELIVTYFDQLVTGKSHLISRSPVGFLYNAIKNSEFFVLPDSKQNELKKDKIEERKRKLEQKKQQEDAASRRRALESEYQQQHKQELNKIKDELESHIIENIKVSVEQDLVKIKRLISDEHYKEIVENKIEETIAQTFALPSFEEWLMSKDKGV